MQLKVCQQQRLLGQRQVIKAFTIPMRGLHHGLPKRLFCRSLASRPDPLNTSQPVIPQKRPILAGAGHARSCTKPLTFAVTGLFAAAGLVGVTALYADSGSQFSMDAKQDHNSALAMRKNNPSDNNSHDSSHPVETYTPKGKDKPMVVLRSSDPGDAALPKLVILGSGWGATSLLKDLQPGAYDTIVISPENYFLFSPLLPEATVGSVEARSLMEGMRSICRRSRAKYAEAEACDVYLEDKMIEVVARTGDRFLVPYDKLVVAVGAGNASFGVPGVGEYTRYLKTIQDARRIRYDLTNLFETAALPTTPPEEKTRLLSFVVAGGGPTGIEFAAELYDYLNEDVKTFFPDLVKNHATITIIQSGEHVLNTFSEAVSDYAERKLAAQKVNLVTNARVVEVTGTDLTYQLKHPVKGQSGKVTIPSGLCLWSTGVGMREFTQKLNEKLRAQSHRRALLVNSRLQLLGPEDGSIYALGDCSTIETPRLLAWIQNRFRQTGKTMLDREEFASVIENMIQEYPSMRSYYEKLDKLFTKYDIDQSGTLELSEIKTMAEELGKRTTSLPATAQVASQQGAYLAKKLNHLANFPAHELGEAEALEKPFAYQHYGSFSYVGGGSAVMDVSSWSGGGLGAYILWKSVYLSEQVSMRTRVLLAFDWMKSFFFGRPV